MFLRCLSLALLGLSGGALGLFWDSLGSLLGVSWLSWSSLGLFWGSLGGLLGPLGTLLGSLGVLLGFEERPGGLWEAFWEGFLTNFVVLGSDF
jgi:hypothetical protein